jgi:hypothetical protein
MVFPQIRYHEGKLISAINSIIVSGANLRLFGAIHSYTRNFILPFNHVRTGQNVLLWPYVIFTRYTYS